LVCVYCRHFTTEVFNEIYFIISLNRYGDQALFFRKEVFNALGGFPLVPLMEDYDLVQRVRQLGVGRVSLLPVDDEGKGHLKNDGSTKQCGGQNGSSSDVRKSLRVITSARRWEEHGVIWTTVMNQVLLLCIR
jgi:hypothetical protein